MRHVYISWRNGGIAVSFLNIEIGSAIGLMKQL